MSDWAVGDLAVCVDAGPWHNSPQSYVQPPSITLEEGRSYRVSALVIAPNGKAGMLVDGEPPHILVSNKPTAWGCTRFRKILHDKHESCETEFVTLLNRIKRKVSA